MMLFMGNSNAGGQCPPYNFNPVKHGYVDCVCDWPYSTFHRYVRSGVYPIAWAGTGSETDDAVYGE